MTSHSSKEHGTQCFVFAFYHSQLVCWFPAVSLQHKGTQIWSQIWNSPIGSIVAFCFVCKRGGDFQRKQPWRHCSSSKLIQHIEKLQEAGTNETVISTVHLQLQPISCHLLAMKQLKGPQKHICTLKTDHQDLHPNCQCLKKRGLGRREGIKTLTHWHSSHCCISTNFCFLLIQNSSQAFSAFIRHHRCENTTTGCCVSWRIKLSSNRLNHHVGFKMGSKQDQVEERSAPWIRYGTRWFLPYADRYDLCYFRYSTVVFWRISLMYH